MSVSIKELIEILGKKDQKSQVEFIVVKTTGELVCVDIEAKAKDMVEMLKLFGR